MTEMILFLESLNLWQEPGLVDSIRKACFSTNNMVRAHVAGRSMERITWTKPKDYFVKINFDGLVCQSLAAAGFIIRDHVGRPVIAGPQNWGENTISVAEATALRELKVDVTFLGT